MQQRDWDEAVANVGHGMDDLQLLARCLDVRQHLDAWRAGGDSLPGTLAADALDQALGLLDELQGGRAASLASDVRRLLEALPPSLD